MNLENRIARFNLAALVTVYMLCMSPVFGQPSGPPPLPPLPPISLNIWLLDQPAWTDVYGDPATAFTNLNAAPGWDSDAGTALSIDTNDVASLNYPVIDGFGDTNISLAQGSIYFWFQPNWTSTADGGNGPTNWASLLTVGQWTSNASASCWSLVIDPDGTNLIFLAQSNGDSQLVLTAPIDFDAGDWHNICLSYSETNCALYLEGLLVTNAGPIQYLPTAADCATYGFFVGSESSGIFQARGQFQDLETYAGPMPSEYVAWDYDGAAAAILNAGGSLPGSGGGGFHGDDGPPAPTNVIGGGGGPLGSPITLTPGTNLWLIITLQTNQTASILLSNTVAGLPYLLLSATNLNGPWVTNQFVLAATNTALAAPVSIDSAAAEFFKAVQEAPGTLKWKVFLGGIGDYLVTNGIDCSPALSPDGTLYVTASCNNSSTNDFIFAIDSLTGSIKWSNNILTNDVETTSFPSEISSSPAIAADGSIYIGSFDGHLCHLATNGVILSNLNLGVGVFTSPAIGPDGTVYIGSDDTATGTNAGFFAVTNSVVKWQYYAIDNDNFGGPPNFGDIDSSPALGADGTIYFTAEAAKFTAVSTNGNLQWFTFTPGHNEPDCSPAIGPDGTLYDGGGLNPGLLDTFFYAVNPDGSVKWVFDEGAPPSPLDFVSSMASAQSSPVVGPDGTIYFGATDENVDPTVVFALNPDGTLKWIQQLLGLDNSLQACSTPALAADGTIYIGSADTNFYAITNAGTNVGIKWFFPTGGPIQSSPVIGPDGTIYVGSSDGFLYAFYGSSPLATNASWPMFRKNPTHTACQTPSRPAPSDCGAPFVYEGALTTDGSGNPASFSFNIVATNMGIWNVFASGDLTNWAETGSVTLGSDGTTDSNGVAVFTTNFVSLVTNQYFILADGDCPSNSCRSKIIGFTMMNFGEGANLIADQLYDVQDLTNQFRPMNTLNELFGPGTSYPGGGTTAIVTLDGSGFDTNICGSEFIVPIWSDSGGENFHTTLLPGGSGKLVNSGTAFTFPVVGLIRNEQVFEVQAGMNFLSATQPVAGTITNLTGYVPYSGDVIQLIRSNAVLLFTNNGSTWSPGSPAVGVGEGFILMTTNAAKWTNTWNQGFPCSGP